MFGIRLAARARNVRLLSSTARVHVGGTVAALTADQAPAIYDPE